MDVAEADEALRGLAESLRPALLRLSRRMRWAAQKAGVSALDAQLLHAIKVQPGIGASELASREQMTRASMSGHVKRLREIGWIGGQPDGEDARRIGLCLTASGVKALEAIRRRRNDWLVERLRTLDAEARGQLAAAAGPLRRLAGDS